MTNASRLNEAQKDFLANAAQRYIWWEIPNGAMTYPQRILTQVMNIGAWKDICNLAELFPQKELENVLKAADIGQFNERSWHFWHNRFSKEVPPMPRRILQ